jgi:hypothetical protein
MEKRKNMVVQKGLLLITCGVIWATGRSCDQNPVLAALDPVAEADWLGNWAEAEEAGT